ncbi:MAG: proteasome subunit alpha [Candidatus Poribacteria bacterium]|nr:proteasome subunit alpha [Candidatus Poribacteria bacterium]MDE0504503.1 proteasome subunit alpha [Candidatus Poribacteria bacterium]
MSHKGDFLTLLKSQNCHIQLGTDDLNSGSLPFGAAGDSGTHSLEVAEGTTVIAVRYQDGILIAGDRRATAGTSVMYDRAEKVLSIDDYSVLAISGSPAIAYEVARVLEHSFQYFRRSQLQELSVEGKLRMLSRLIRENLPMALQGIGGVIPILALYDMNHQEDENGGKIYFYDALGAHFENAAFAVSGSGSVWIRGILRYLDRWEGGPLAEMDLQKATRTVLRLLDTASEYDVATSGYNPKSRIFPTAKTITREGIRDLPEQQLDEIYTESVDVDYA